MFLSTDQQERDSATAYRKFTFSPHSSRLSFLMNFTGNYQNFWSFNTWSVNTSVKTYPIIFFPWMYKHSYQRVNLLYVCVYVCKFNIKTYNFIKDSTPLFQNSSYLFLYKHSASNMKPSNANSLLIRTLHHTQHTGQKTLTASVSTARAWCTMNYFLFFCFVL